MDDASKIPSPDTPDDHRPLSALLKRLGDAPSDRVRICDVLQGEGDQAYAAVLFSLSAPNVVPVLPPGVVTGTGVMLVPICLQMLLGVDSPKLPGWLQRRGVSHPRFDRAARALQPKVQWVERVTRPRGRLLFCAAGRRLIAFVCLAMAVLILVPIPFVNMAPGAAIALMAVGLIENDGLFVLGGFAAAAASIGLAFAIYHLAGMGAHGLHGLFNG